MRLFLVLLLFSPSPVWATTWYVRTDGGTSTECTGRVDAPYPGSGTGQPCAWSPPFYGLTASGTWKIAGGDTIVIGDGSYMLGFGAPNSASWCDQSSAWDCHLPPLPSGQSAASPTRLVGAAWQTGCGTRPELWGTERAWHLFDLTNTQNAVLSCLELTDHSSCVEFHPNAQVSCERNTPPFGPWTGTGIYAENSSGVTLRDLDIHGFSDTGIHAGGLSNWVVDNVRIAGNGWAGWDGVLARRAPAVEP